MWGLGQSRQGEFMNFGVVIPCYKRPEMLDLTIEGLHRLPEVDFQDIVVSENLANGRSNNQQVADKHNIKYVGVDYGETFSKSAVCNSGLDLITNEHVLFCDQDSWFPDDYLQKVSELHDEYENLLIFTDAYHIESIDELHYTKRIPGDDAMWSTFDDIVPVWHFQYIDGNCSCKTKYAQEARWDDSYQKYGGELRKFAYRMAITCGVAPIIVEYIWYFHIEHDKSQDKAYHDKYTADDMSGVEALQGKLKVRRNG